MDKYIHREEEIETEKDKDRQINQESQTAKGGNRETRRRNENRR